MPIIRTQAKMKFGYSMPSASPLYPESPYYFNSNRVISIIFRTTTEILQELVPVPLRPNPDNLAFVYIGEFNVDAPLKGKYREAGVGIPTIYKGKVGNYFVSLNLDSAHAIVGGREIWGWPKKDAEITFTVTQDLFQARVRRAGITLITASVNAVEKVELIPDQPDFPPFNLKIVPSVQKDHFPDILQLTSAITVSARKELARGSATLSFASSPADQLEKQLILEIIGGEQYVGDLSLDCGEVLFDYLKESQ
jgi:acetoacetate decarboxylase